MIAVVNYGSGNIQAICNIYKRLGVQFSIASKPDEVRAGDKILLPGVGAFDQAMSELERSGLRAALDECVLVQKKPILGICVGMQLLAKSSDEGSLPGLGWIDGRVRKFDLARFKRGGNLPHMGWNTISSTRPDGLLRDIDPVKGFYFLHSYYFSCENPAEELARTDYGGEYACAVNLENIYGL